MKKFLTVLGCLIGFAGIVVLCYFFGYGSGEIVMPEGKYYLQQTRESVDEIDWVETKIDNSSLYLQVFEGNKLQSFSGDVGVLQDASIFDCEVYGTGLQILLNGEAKYEGFFVENLIIVRAKEKRQIDGEDKEFFVEYHYELK